MKNAIYALVLAPVVALAAPAAEPPALRLNVDSLLMTGSSQKTEFKAR